MFDPFSPEVLADPHTHFRWLRDHSPCHRVEAKDIWVISRHADVVAAAKNHACFSSTQGVGPEWKSHPMMPMYDPPEHSRMRRLVSKPFTPAATAMLSTRIEQEVARLLDAFLEAGHADLISDFAIPLSLGVIADLIGMPQEDRPSLRKWSQGIVDALAGNLDHATAQRAELSRREFVGYLKHKVSERREANSDSNDVLTKLRAASEEDKLSDREVVAFGVLLLTAGFETTVNAIANGVLALMEHPAECERVRGDLGLVPTLIEEVVRYDGPVSSFFRNTTADVVVAGTTIPSGVKVLLGFASANRDERQFRDADSFLVDRKPNDHIGYGVGIHYCLGAPLARAQLAHSFRGLLARTRSFRPDGEIVRSSNVLFRGVRTMPLRIEAR